MAARKEKPTVIFREEIHGAGLYNSTRQTFNPKMAELWRNLPAPPWPGSTRRILVGRIAWKDANEVGVSASDDYRCDHDFPGWTDLTSEQKGHVADVEQAAYWRGYNDSPTVVGGGS